MEQILQSWGNGSFRNNSTLVNTEPPIQRVRLARKPKGEYSLMEAEEVGTGEVIATEQLTFEQLRSLRDSLLAVGATALVLTIENELQPREEAVWKDFEVQLRFLSSLVTDWTVDPDNPGGAWHTQQVIPPESIEALVFERWVPILSLDLAGLIPIIDGDIFHGRADDHL